MTVKLKRRALVLTPLALCAGASRAAPDLVVAQVAPMSGPLGPNGQANYLGAKAHFDLVNAQGGIQGAKIRFVREDDQYKPQETIRLLEGVAQRDKPVAFVNLLGSANAAVVLKEKLLERLAIPVIGCTPGAESLRRPGSPWLFHVHAGDRAQIRKILTHLSTIGMSRISVVYQDIPFGKSGVAHIDEMAGALSLQVLSRVAVPAGADNLTAAAAELKKSGAQSYLMVLAPNSGTSLVRDVRSGQDHTPIYGMSYVPAKGVVDKAPAGSAVGVALAQVTPNASSQTTGLTRDFHAAMDKYAPPGTEHSQLHLVGFIAARVTVGALQKAGAAPTPERLAQVLRNLRLDLGGYLLDFTSGDNVGTQYVDIGVIDHGGRLVY